MGTEQAFVPPDHPCSACAAFTDDVEFDYCRVCGYGEPAPEIEKPALSPIQQALRAAGYRGFTGTRGW